jgi:pyrimidine operon attenuation protein/uracil phosphoribosyltransferase
MTADQIESAVNRMAADIVAGHGGEGRLVLLGILRRGRPLADRLARRIEETTSKKPQVGSLATTLYRDDLRSGKGAAKISAGETHFDFDVNGAPVAFDRTSVSISSRVSSRSASTS